MSPAPLNLAEPNKVTNKRGPADATLGASDIVVPPVAIGAEALGNFDWGDLDIAAVEAAIHEAIARGLCFFDVADCYGRGEAEKRLGAIVAGQRQRAIIATKFGVRFDPAGKTYFDNAPAYIARALEASLKRLGTDYIDLYQLHWPDCQTPLNDVFAELVRLREAGKIRAFGITNTPLVASTVDRIPDGLVSFSNEYSLANRTLELEIEERISKFGLSFLSWGSLGQGMLSGKYGASSKFTEGDRRNSHRWRNFHGEHLARNVSIVGEMRAIAGELGDVQPIALAVRWIMWRFKGAIPIVGVKSPQHVADLSAALDVDIPDEAFLRLDQASATTR